MTRRRITFTAGVGVVFALLVLISWEAQHQLATVVGMLVLGPVLVVLAGSFLDEYVPRRSQ